MRPRYIPRWLSLSVVFVQQNLDYATFISLSASSRRLGLQLNSAATECELRKCNIIASHDVGVPTVGVEDKIMDEVFRASASRRV
jgi:hypothetical protein